MDSTEELRTARLLLRPVRESDLDRLARVTADPRVMADLPGPLSRDQCDALLARSRAHFRQHGFGLWGVEVTGRAPFIGLAGLWSVRQEVPISPCVELGWRLDPGHWGRGYATEASLAILALAFERAGLDEVVAFTVDHNARSRRVMEKLGMRRDPTRDFAHPLLPAGHPFRQQRVYCLERRRWSGPSTRAG